MKKVIPLTILALILIPAYVVAAKSDTVSATKPSIVLVHGAWADGSSWSRVIALLQDQGYTVYAPANSLRGLASDSAYIADFLHAIPGPIVLVGHSYGGAVITNAAAGDPTQVFNFVPLTSGGVDTYVKQSLFPSCFANDLPPSQGAVLASTQRAFALSALAEKSGVPAWKTIPSWYLVGTIDLAIPSWAQLFMAQRAGSTMVQVRASHLSMISHAPAVSDLIQQAATTVTGNSDSNSQLALAPTSL